MRGINCRGLRLQLVAGLGIALAMPALAASAVATTTTLTAGTLSGCSQPLTITVTAGGQPVAVTAGGQPIASAVYIEDLINGQEVQLAGVALNSEGTSSATLPLTAGSHTLTAVYTGNSSYATSTSSPAVSVDITNANSCPFTPAVSPATASLTAGQLTTATVTITPSPEFVSSLTGPAFVTLSCGVIPDQTSCTFTPENVEIQPGQNAGVISSMEIQTEAASLTSASPANRPGKGSSPIAWAFLLPGALGLGGLAWGTRRRLLLSRLSLVALVGLVTLLGTTACNPRYAYEHHGPIPNLPTPAGNYTVIVTAQYSNGVTVDKQSTTFELTVN